MHPHIIRLYEVVETPTDIFVVRCPADLAGSTPEPSSR